MGNIHLATLMLSALTWVVLFHGPPPTTSSCARVTDLNTPLMDMLSVDLPLFLSLLPTVTPARMERSCSLHGPKKISEPEERDGGTKLLPVSRLRPISALCG